MILDSERPSAMSGSEERAMCAKSRNVLVVTLRYPPYVAGGYELLTRDAVEALRCRGHRVTVLAGRGVQLEGESGVLPWLEPDLDGDDDMFGAAGRASNSEQFRLHFLRLSNLQATRRALSATDADVLLFFNLGLVSLAPILAARFHGVPTLGYIADLWPLNHWVRGWRDNRDRAFSKPDQLKALVGAWRVFRGVTCMGRLLAPSEFVAGELAGDGIERASIGVLPLGLAPAMARHAQAMNVRKRAKTEPLRVICSSMMWTGKGQHLLLEAGVLAVARGVDLQLYLAGTGPAEYRARLEQLAARPELAGRVQFGGMLTARELSDELSSSHVFALPGEWGEPFGLVTLEAMAHGVCPLVSDAGASSEIVRHGVDGLVFSAGNINALAEGLERLAGDETERERLADSGRNRVRADYDHGDFIASLEDELETVCRKGAL